MFNKFQLRLIVFLSPVLLLAILIEMFIVFYPNTFNLKATHQIVNSKLENLGFN